MLSGLTHKSRDRQFESARAHFLILLGANLKLIEKYKNSGVLSYTMHSDGNKLLQNLLQNVRNVCRPFYEHPPRSIGTFLNDYWTTFTAIGIGIAMSHFGSRILGDYQNFATITGLSVTLLPSLFYRYGFHRIVRDFPVFGSTTLYFDNQTRVEEPLKTAKYMVGTALFYYASIPDAVRRLNLSNSKSLEENL